MSAGPKLTHSKAGNKAGGQAWQKYICSVPSYPFRIACAIHTRISIAVKHSPSTHLINERFRLTTGSQAQDEFPWIITRWDGPITRWSFSGSQRQSRESSHVPASRMERIANQASHHQIQRAMESCLGKSVMSGVMGFGMGGLFGMFMASVRYFSSLLSRSVLSPPPSY